MRIAHIVNYFMPEMGYTEYYLAKKQKDLGHDVCIITSDHYMMAPTKWYRKKGHFVEEEIEVFRLPSFIELAGFTLVSFNKFKEVLTDFSPDIIHLQGILSPLALASILYKEKIGYKVVADIITGRVAAEGLELAIKSTFLKVYTKTIWPHMFHKTDAFFAISEASIDWMYDNLNIDPSQVHFFPLGVDNDLFRFNPEERIRIRRTLGLHDNDIVGIFTGKFTPDKKVDIFLCSAAPLIKSHDNFKILLVGTGMNKYLHYLNELISRLGISNSVIMHEPVHRTRLPSFISAADLAVWPGGPSISIIESMSIGLPIIISRSKWTNHLLEYENGFDFPEDDVIALRVRIQSLLEDDNLRRRMGENSRKLVEEKLNWNCVATKYLGLYQSLMKKKDD